MRNRNGKLLGLLAVLTAGTNLYAITPDENDGGNRFSAITERNVFGLKAPPPPPDPTANIKVEPPKLKLQGISLILGKKQVLVKVLPKPPTRPKEESMLLTEGDRKDDIEVLSIDHLGEKVDFRIGGSPVTLTMKDDSERPAAGAAPAFPPPGGVAGAPGIVPPPGTVAPNPAAAYNATAATTIGGRSALPPRPLRTTVTDSGAVPQQLGGVPTPQLQQQGVVPGAGQKPMTPDEQVVMMELQREANKDNPKFPPLPPTPLSQPNAGGQAPPKLPTN